MIRYCLICSKEFYIKGLRRKLTAKYCSKKCEGISRLGKPTWNKGIKTGLIPKTAFKKGHVSLHKFPKGHIPWNKGIKWYAMRGKNHPAWKGGKPKTNRRETMTYEQYRKYLDWQKDVFTRDNWECQICGHHGGTLHADHIKSWALYPGLRFSVDNGRTLCPPCHRKTPSYGKTVTSL